MAVAISVAAACVGGGLSGPRVLDRASFPDFEESAVGPGHIREDVDPSGVPIFGFFIDDSTRMPVIGGIATLGLNRGGAISDSTGRYFFLAPAGSHRLVGIALGYAGDTVLVDVGDVPVRADFVLAQQNLSLSGTAR